MTCGTQDKDDGLTKSIAATVGLVSSHAYTIINVVEIKGEKLL